MKLRGLEAEQFVRVGIGICGLIGVAFGLYALIFPAVGMMILTDDNHVSDLVLLVVGGAFVFALLGAIVAWLLFSRRPFA